MQSTVLKCLKGTLIAFLLLLPAFLVLQTNHAHVHRVIRAHAPTLGDQDGIYQSFKGAMEGQVPAGIQNGWMPVGYLSLIGFYHRLSALWTTPDIFSTFVWNGLFYAVFAALISGLLMFRVAVDQSPQTDRLKLALGCALLWAAMFRLSVILRFVWLPWSHYASAFVALAFVACVYETLMRRRTWSVLGAGFFACLFFFTRRHEAMAVFLGTGMISAALLCQTVMVRKNPGLLCRLFRWLPAAIFGAGAAVFFIHYFSNGMPLNGHYAHQRALDSYVNEYLTLYPGLFPLRFIQTFFDPNYYSYENTYHVLSVFNHAFTMAKFRMPMIFQLPILWYLLPVSVLFFSIILFREKIWKRRLQPAVLMFLLAFIPFLVLFVAYPSTAIWGSRHLRHGLAREFVLSLLLLTVAMGPGIYLCLFKNRNVWVVPVSGILFFSLILGQIFFVKFPGLLTVPATHISRALSPGLFHCEGGICHINLHYADELGQPVRPPVSRVVIRMNCGTGIAGNFPGINEAGLSDPRSQFDFGVIPCKVPVDVEVFPLTSGSLGTGDPMYHFRACPPNLPSCARGKDIV